MNKLRTPKGKWITANRYLALARKNECPCEHGHMACAGWSHGPCTDELLTLIENGEKIFFTDERD